MLSIKPRQRAGKKGGGGAGGIFSRQHNSPEFFQSYFGEKIEKHRKCIVNMGDFNIGL